MKKEQNILYHLMIFLLHELLKKLIKDSIKL